MGQRGSSSLGLPPSAPHLGAQAAFNSLGSKITNRAPGLPTSTIGRWDVNFNSGSGNNTNYKNGSKYRIVHIFVGLLLSGVHLESLLNSSNNRSSNSRGLFLESMDIDDICYTSLSLSSMTLAQQFNSFSPYSTCVFIFSISLVSQLQSWWSSQLF